MSAPLNSVDHEQRPNLTEFDGLRIQAPLDFRRRNEGRVFKPTFGGSMPHFVNPRQVELRGLARAREHVALKVGTRASWRFAQATPVVSNAASAMASRGPRFAHKTNWNAWK
jgi:hypothetical protein